MERIATASYTPPPGAPVDEISVEIGDLLILDRRYQDGWGVATNHRTGEKGIFPWDYCFGEESEELEETQEEEGGKQTDRTVRGHQTTSTEVELDTLDGSAFRLSGTTFTLPGSFLDEEAADHAMKVQTATHVRKASAAADILTTRTDGTEDHSDELFGSQAPPPKKPSTSALSTIFASSLGQMGLTAQQVSTIGGSTASSNSLLEANTRSTSRQSNSTTSSLSISKPLSFVAGTRAPSSISSISEIDSTALPVSNRKPSDQEPAGTSGDSGDVLIVGTGDGGFSYRFPLNWKNSKTTPVEEIMGTVGGPGWEVQRSWGYKLSRNDPHSLLIKFDVRNRSLKDLEMNLPLFSFTIFFASAALYSSVEHLMFKLPSLTPDNFRNQILTPLSTLHYRFKRPEPIVTEWALIEPPPQFWRPGCDLHVAYIVRDASEERVEGFVRRRVKLEVGKWIDQNMRMGDW
ncbi:hypothetical protein HDU93_000261, partial [Gonapodya sp. JEL0774]